MGGRLVIPEADANITKVVKAFQFTPQDISDFWKIFQKWDKEKTGLIQLSQIFQTFETERNLYTDCLLELLDIEHDGEINFSDFLLMVTTYCFFEPMEILRFCFYCFDQDKTGFFSVDDLNRLMNVVHNVRLGNTVKGTVKASWMLLAFKEDQIDFNEFAKIHTNFPRLFEPAFRLQQQMMVKTKGELWWTLKKRALQNVKEDEALKILRLSQRKERRKQQKRNKKTQRNMGLLRYYMCPCLRKYYDPSTTEVDKMTAEQKLEREQQVKLQRRQQELKIKNPETAEWLKYKKKVEEELGIIEEDREFEMKGKTDTLLSEQQKAKADSAAASVVPSSASSVSSLSLTATQRSSATKERKGSSASSNSRYSLSTVDDMEDEMASVESNKAAFMENKHASTSRPREDRAVSRAQRRQDRKKELKSM